MVVIASAVVQAQVVIQRTRTAALVHAALSQPPRTALQGCATALGVAAIAGDDIDHPANRLAAVNDRGRAANHFNARYLRRGQLGNIRRTCAAAVDQYRDLATVIAALAISVAATDVDRGLARRPFTEKAHGVLSQQIGEVASRGTLDLITVDHLHSAGDILERLTGARCADQG